MDKQAQDAVAAANQAQGIYTEEQEEQIEAAYYEASASVEALFKTLTPQQVRNLMQQYLVGVFDVGVAEALSMEQIEGVTIWLKDLVGCAEHLDLSVGCEPGEYPTWE